METVGWSQTQFWNGRMNIFLPSSSSGSSVISTKCCSWWIGAFRNDMGGQQQEGLGRNCPFSLDLSRCLGLPTPLRLCICLELTFNAIWVSYKKALSPPKTKETLKTAECLGMLKSASLTKSLVCSASESTHMVLSRPRSFKQNGFRAPRN